MTKKRSDFILSAAVLVLAMAIFVMTRRFPRGRVGIPGPDFFPNLVAGALVVLGIALFVRTYFFFTDHQHPESGVVDAKQSWKLVVATVLTAILYCGIMEWLGFIVATFLFLVVLASSYRMRKWWKVSLFALSVTLVTYVVFARFLLVQLPMGFFMQ